MTDRRRPPDHTFLQGGSPAYQRIIERMDQREVALDHRLDTIWDRLDQRLSRIDRDLAAREQDHSSLRSEVAELKNDIGELRDAASAGADKTVAAVVAATPAVLPPVLAKTIPQTWWGKLLIAATGFTTIMVAVNNVPDLVRGWDHFWAFLRNDTRPVAEAKRDETND